MRILLLGGNGQLGFELQRSLSVFGEILATTRSGELPNGAPCFALDMADTDALEALIDQERPNIIVNAAAYTQVDRAETDQELADRVNHLAPAAMAAKARDLGALLIHFSSDYVYSGVNSVPWRESDPCIPTSVYGKTKLAGDYAIRDTKCAYWILRTQWLYSARGSNFMRTMLAKAQAGQSLKVVADQIGSPTSVRLLASSVASMLARWLTDLTGPGQSSTGTYHVAASGQCSWYEFAQEIFAHAQRIGILKDLPALASTTTAEFMAPAPRPRFGVLNTTKIRREFDLYLPDWQTGLRQTLHEYAGLK